MPIDREDEMRSIQYYLSLALPDKEIRIERPPEGEPYDILIDDVDEETEQQGRYLEWQDILLVINCWEDSKAEVRRVTEAIRQYIAQGTLFNSQKKIPVWEWDWDLTTAPDPQVDEPDNFLKVSNLSTKILPAEENLQYVGIINMTARGHRITHNFGGDLLNTVNKESEVEE